MLSLREVKHITELARIDINEEQSESLRKDLLSIVDFVAILEKADTKDAEQFSAEGFVLEDRPEKAIACQDDLVQRMLKLAPESEGRYVKVRSVLS